MIISAPFSRKKKRDKSYGVQQLRVTTIPGDVVQVVRSLLVEVSDFPCFLLLEAWSSRRHGGEAQVAMQSSRDGDDGCS